MLRRIAGLSNSGCPLSAAIALKGAAYESDSRDRDRHLEDGIALLACVDDAGMLVGALSKSMRKNFNRLVLGLGANRAAWRNVPPQLRDSADSILSIARQDWKAPWS